MCDTLEAACARDHCFVKFPYCSRIQSCTSSACCVLYWCAMSTKWAVSKQFWEFLVLCAVHRYSQQASTGIMQIMCLRTVLRWLYQMHDTERWSHLNVFQPSEMSRLRLIYGSPAVGFENGFVVVTNCNHKFYMHVTSEHVHHCL